MMPTDQLLKLIERRGELRRERQTIERELRSRQEEETRLKAALSAAQKESARLSAEVEALRSASDFDAATSSGIALSQADEHTGIADTAAQEYAVETGNLNHQVREIIGQADSIDRTLRSELLGKDAEAIAGPVVKLRDELVDELEVKAKLKRRPWTKELKRLGPLIIVWREMNGGKSFPVELDFENAARRVLGAIGDTVGQRLNAAGKRKR